MDTGTNNNNNTFYEVGYYKGQPSSGFPAAGSTINSLAQPDHHYQMPASYTTNDCVYLDATHPTANITIASPATYSAFSFLSADGNGTATNQAIMQYADGTSETNQFNALDWFNNTPVAYYANGRIDMNRGTINNDPGRNGNIATGNPRLYEAQFALGNTGSPVTNILLRFLNPTNSGTRSYVFAVSATAGAVPPIIASVSRSTAAAIYEGTNVTFNAVISGGTAPITYQWQKGTNGVYVNLVNGGNIAGVTTTNLVITGATTSNVGDYRLVASNITGPVASGILTISRVVSPLNDVTSPGDTITITTGTAGGGAEAVTSAVDNTIQKFLGVSTTPFSGSGFIVKPALGNTIVSVLRIYTANDAEGRDPADYVLEGSLDGIGFTAISSGSLALPSGRNGTATDVPNPLVHNLQEVKFVNTNGYTYYRVQVNNVKDNSQNLMQVGEVDLLGILNPTPPPSFAANVADVSANEGSTATFISSAVGPAPLTYQWYDVTAGDPGTAILNKTNANLVLPGVTAGQNGNRYRVVATNPYGSTTNPAPALPGAQLTVTTGPVSIVQDLPAESLFYAGRTGSLTVQVAGTSPAYQWQTNGVNLVDGGRISGANSNILTISNIKFSDAASYQVITSNQISGPLASSASQVYVTATPTFHTNGIGWQVINGGTSLPSIGSDTFSMTFNGNERAAAWFTAPMNINAFKASFLYQDVSVGGADGFGFVMQNSASGTNALGGGGGFMAYSGITNSAAVLFNIFNQSSVAFGSNGVIGGYGSTLPVNLPSGNPIMVNLNYAGSTLTVTLSNTVTADVFTTNMVVGSLASIVGTNVAYIGITAATGGVSSQQQVSNFQYIPVPSLAAQSAGGLANLTWPASIGGYSVQSGSNLSAPVWSTVNALINQVNGNNQVTVSPTNSAEFYRLIVVPTP